MLALWTRGFPCHRVLARKISGVQSRAGGQDKEAGGDYFLLLQSIRLKVYLELLPVLAAKPISFVV